MTQLGPLSDARVCICVGAGGVGKTTTAAALAVGAALRGLKVAVITIDPAPRLAQALALERLENQPIQIQLGQVEQRSTQAERGELWAMRLDVQRTLDELVALLLVDEQARSELLENRVYRQLSNALAGSHEFSAVVKLHELDQAQEYDVLVLDTPPSRSALDLLDAPDRLTRFLDSRALEMLLGGTHLGARVVGGTAGMMLRMLSRLTGAGMLDDAAAFLVALGDVRIGFKERAERVRQLLRDPATNFLLVTAAEPLPVREAIFLGRKLRHEGMRLGGVVVNRVHHDGLDELDVCELTEALREDLDAALAARVADTLAEYHDRAQRGEHETNLLARALGLHGTIDVPELDQDVCDLEGLAYISRFLFADERERTALMNGLVC